MFCSNYFYNYFRCIYLYMVMPEIKNASLFRIIEDKQLEDREDHLQFVTCWELEKKYRILPVSMIADAAFAFQDIVRGEEDKLEHGECVFDVWKKKYW